MQKMTYKFRVGLAPRWSLSAGDESSAALTELLALLAAIETQGHIAGACKACGLSYRHGWGLLRRFESLFGAALLITRRRQGSELSLFAERLLLANQRMQARLAPMLDSLASELQEELERLSPQHQPPLRLHASHGFAVEALAQRAQGLELRYRNASEALAAGDCDLAGFQLPQGELESDMLAHYRQWLDGERHGLIHLAVRNTGFFVMAGNPKGIAGIDDLARPDVRFVNRQIGSSTRLVAQLLLQRRGIAAESVQGFQTNEFTHMAIAAHIASGMADVGIGVETAARRFGLDFIPLIQERYFFAFRRVEQSAVEDFLQTLRSAAYLAELQQLTGYDARDCGRVLSLGEV